MRRAANSEAFDLRDSQLSLPGLADDWVWCEEEEETVAFTHETVMKNELVAALSPRAGGVYLDATVGGGGTPRPFSKSTGRVSSRSTAIWPQSTRRPCGSSASAIA